MWRRFATFGLQKAKYLCPYKSRKVLSQALQFQTLTAQSPVGYVKHRLAPVALHQTAGHEAPAIGQNKKDQFERQRDHDRREHHHAHRHEN